MPEVDSLSSRLSSDIRLLANLMGGLHKAPMVDARHVTVVLNSLTEDDFAAVLRAKALIGSIAPELLETPDEGV